MNVKVRATQAILECLLEQEVDTVFGYPGGTILNLYDELYNYQDKIHHILTAHEQGASHAADGYARSTGKTGVCLATSGPGATNLVTAIATAYMDSSPVVFLTGNVPQQLMGTDSFQEADILGITMSITKHSWLVTDVTTVSYTHLDVYKRQDDRRGLLPRDCGPLLGGKRRAAAHRRQVREGERRDVPARRCV